MVFYSGVFFPTVVWKAPFFFKCHARRGEHTGNFSQATSCGAATDAISTPWASMLHLDVQMCWRLPDMWWDARSSLAWRIGCSILLP